MRYSFLILLLGGAVLLQGCASTPEAAITPAAPAAVNTPVPAPTPIPSNRFKHKIAIARLTLPSGNAGGSETLAHATAQAKSLLEDRVRQAGKFMLLEHGLLHIPFENDNLRVVNDETLGADFLVTGRLLRHELAMPGFLDGWRDTPTAHAFSSVQLDIIDGHTGQVIYSQHFEGDASKAVTASADFTPEQQASLQLQALTLALDHAAPPITDTLLHQHWRSQILSTQQGYVLVNSGAGQGIQVGDLFHVLSPEQSASTAAAVTPVSPFVATLKVVAQAGEKENELSVCELVEGSLPEGATHLSVRDAP